DVNCGEFLLAEPVQCVLVFERAHALAFEVYRAAQGQVVAVQGYELHAVVAAEIGVPSAERYNDQIVEHGECLHVAEGGGPGPIFTEGDDVQALRRAAHVVDADADAPPAGVIDTERDQAVASGFDVGGPA